MRVGERVAGATLALLFVLAGCTPTVPSAEPAATLTPSTTASPTPTRSPSPTVTATPTITPTPTETTPAADTRKGKQLNTPYTVKGIPVVSKKHRITAAYRPKSQTGPHRLTKETASALKKMTAAARKAGVRIVVRSGYRSYSDQAAIFKRQLATYPSEELARRYNAEPGRSEHQTGLAVDLWDGVTWGLGVRNTATGRWLWKHSREYGFILRYPPGKEKITGYAYEPWHFRYIGTEHSLKFKPNATKTLEGYLGIG